MPPAANVSTPTLSPPAPRMKAYPLDEFGPPEVMQQREVERPAPGPGEVLVRVVATSVNPVDYKLRSGEADFGLEAPAVLGYDVSGIVEQTGEGVERFGEGDAVFYTPEIDAQGSYAEYHVAEAAIVARKPTGLSHEEAAALPLAGCTAWQALFDRAILQAGQTVLVHGTGGVGLLAVQLAHAAGAEVVAVSSPTLTRQTAERGASRVIDYQSEDPAEVMQQAGVRAEVVLDTVGGDTLFESAGVAAPGADLVTIVESAEVPAGPLMPLNASVHFTMMQRRGATMRSLARFAERGLLRPAVADVLPLADVAEAHRRLESGGVPGKLVLRV
ncbi:MAG: NADPH:quinone oxidoreductase [Bacteroidetes bacterium QS_9_68_14]|nr:MAG: NADPH:quinone oxidoreductase [Bacteroidetes bacterium QS_9_68_14]